MSDSAPRQVEEHTRNWLEERYLRAMAGLRDPAAEAIAFESDGRPRRMSRYHFQELQRKLKIFRTLDRVDFESCIDIGSGFDVYPQRMGERYGVPAFYADLVHSMNLPYGGAEFGRLDSAVTLNLTSLPFQDGAFDAVLCSEVLEHLVRPVEAIAELVRITRRVLVMTSLEALSASRRERLLSHWLVDVRVPHVERNFLLANEIETLLGDGLQHENLLYDPDLPASAFDPPDRQAAAYAALHDIPALIEALTKAVAVGGHGPGAMGILLLKSMPGIVVRPLRPEADADLARWLIARTARFQHALSRVVHQMADGTAPFVERERPIAAALRQRLRCPDCRRGALDPAGAGLVCAACGTRFAGEWGVPILYPTRPRDQDAALAEALDRLCGDDGGRRRSVRRLAARLRRNERPAGAPRRATWRLAPLLRTVGG